jgi:uncharacterized protein YuzE
VTFRYDHENDVLDIRLADGAVSRTDQIDGGTLVDVDMHGHVLTIELIAPGRLWPLDEIIDRYDIADADQAVLHHLWNAGSKFAFARTSDLVPA